MYIECSLRGILATFFRQKAKFLRVFGLIVLTGLLNLSCMDRVYDAHGSFLIKFGQGAVPDVKRSDSQGGDGTSSEISALVQSNIKILQSESLLYAVIDKVGLERLYPGITKDVGGKDRPEHAAIERLQKKDLRVTNDAESSVVEVHVLNKNPQVAKDFTESLIETFITQQAEIYNAPQTNFLEKQIMEAQQKLQDSQKKFQDFKQETGIFNLDGEITQLLTEKGALAGFSLQAVTAAQANLSKLEGDRAAATSTYNADSPVIKRLDDSIGIAKGEVQKRQRDLNASSGDGSALSPKISKLDARMAFLEQRRGEYDALEQSVHMNEDNYKYYYQRGDEARGGELLSKQGMTRISIVDKPVVPVKSEPLRRALLLLALLMTGTLFGIGTVLFFELRDERIAYPEQIPPAVGLPVLSSFGRIQGS